MRILPTSVIVAATLALLGALTLSGSGAAGGAKPTVLVKFKPGVDGAAVVASKGDRVVGQTKTNALIVEVNSGLSASSAVAAYDGATGNEYAEQNVAVQAALASPNDPSYAQQWGPAKINAVNGWSLFPGSFIAPAGPVVAIVDSGVDTANPDLADGRVLIGSGANCVSGVCAAGPAGDDSYGHGTHIAGIVAAATDNGLGVAGLAYNAAILPVKVLDSAGVGSAAGVANGISWAVDHGARVLNLSITTTGYSATLCDAVTYAVNAGALVVAAAGNDATFTNEYPAACAGAVGVAATDQNDAPATFSNYGYPDVFVAAPGVSILSTLPGAVWGNDSGTSMAAPFVTGLGALLLGQSPSRTAATAKQIIAKTAAKVGAGPYSGDKYNVCGGGCTWTSTHGYGRIDAGAALTYGSTPRFSFKLSAARATVTAGTATTATVTIAADPGYAGNVGLSVTGLPTGATASLSPATVAAPGSSTLTVTTAATTAAGTYTVVVKGADAGDAQSTTLLLTVVVPDFTVAATPAAVTVAQGKKATVSLTVGSVNGFAGSVALSATGMSSGVTAAFSPATVTASGSSTLTLTASATATVGAVTLTLKGTAGTASKTVAVSLSVVKPDFAVSATPSSATVLGGQTATYSVSVSVLNGFTGNIAMTATGYPSSSTVAFSPSSVAAPGTSSLTIKPPTAAAPGTYTVTITGTSAAKVAKKATVTLVVNPAGDFSFAASPTALSIKRGSSALVTVSLLGSGGFSCTVALKNDPLPTGVTATWTRASLAVSGTTTSSTTVKLAPGTTAAAGTFAVNLVATCGGVVHSAPVTLTVT